MRRTALSVFGAFVVSVSVVSTASAQFKRQPTPSVVASDAYASGGYSWTGFYVGGHVGHGWSNLSGADPTGGGASNEQASGLLGGIQAGFNYQIGRVVLGVEGDYSFSAVNKTVDDPFGFGGGRISIKNDYFATLALRIGFSFNQFMVYGKGGAAWTRDKWDVTDGIGGTATGTFNRTGWLVGLGVEYSLRNKWSLKGEYNYLNFPTITETLTTTGGLAAAPTDVSLKTHLMKFGVNYRF